MVLYGAASGPPPPVEIAKLNAKSLFLTRPTLAHYGQTGDELRLRAGDAARVGRRGRARRPDRRPLRARRRRARPGRPRIARHHREADPHAVDFSTVVLWAIFAVELAGLVTLGVQRSVVDGAAQPWLIRGAAARARRARWRRASGARASDERLPLGEPESRQRLQNLALAASGGLVAPGRGRRRPVRPPVGVVHAGVLPHRHPRHRRRARGRGHRRACGAAGCRCPTTATTTRMTTTSSSRSPAARSRGRTCSTCGARARARARAARAAPRTR